MAVPPAYDDSDIPAPPKTGDTTLRRKTTHLETAASLIQAIHGTISLGGLFDTLVLNLVEVGGFIGARLEVDATVDPLRLAHTSCAGETDRADLVPIETSQFIRGVALGRLITYTVAARVDDEAGQLGI